MIVSCALYHCAKVVAQVLTVAQVFTSWKDNLLILLNWQAPCCTSACVHSSRVLRHSNINVHGSSVVKQKGAETNKPKLVRLRAVGKDVLVVSLVTELRIKLLGTRLRSNLVVDPWSFWAIDIFSIPRWHLSFITKSIIVFSSGCLNRIFEPQFVAYQVSSIGYNLHRFQ